MKGFFTHFPTYLMLLISLTAICLAIVSSQMSHVKSPNPCFSNQQGTVYPVANKCTSYIYCQQGLPVELPCQLGDGFSNAAKGCVNIDVSDCALMSISTDPPTTTTPTTTTTTTTTTIATTTTTEPTTTTFAACSSNEQSPENRAQCMGKPMGALEPCPGDCSRFLVCDCMYPTVVPCSSGLWFNPKTKGCDLPHNIDCPWATTERTITKLTTGAGSSGSTPSDGASTDHKFTTMNTTETTLRISAQASPTASTTSTEHGEAETLSTTEKTTAITTSTTSSAYIPKGICSSQPPNALLPYAENCAQYISCQDGVPNLFSCPKGFLFDEALLLCNDAQAVTCNSKGMKMVPSEAELCAGATKGTSYAYTSDCSRYYYCNGVSNVPQIFDCPSNNYYNPDSKKCGPEVSPFACHTVLSTTIPAASTLPTAQEQCTNQAPGTILPHFQSCNSYILCDGHGRAIILNCAANNFFDPSTASCALNISPNLCKGNAASSRTTTPTQPNHNNCNEATDGQIVAYPNNCHKYIMCIRPAPIAFKCPANMAFNQQTLECEVPTDDNCRAEQNTSSSMPTTSICEGAAVNSTVAYTENCQFYFRCYESAYMLESCNLGEYYDPSTSKCGADVSPTACISAPASTTTDDTSLENTSRSPTTTGETTLSSSTTWSKPTTRGATSSSSTFSVTISNGRNSSKTIESTSSGALAPTTLTIDNATTSSFETTSRSQTEVMTTTEKSTIGTTSSQTSSSSKTTKKENGDMTTRKTEFSTSSSTTPPATTTIDPPYSCVGLPNESILSDPTNCAQYIVCLSGSPTMIKCFPGTFFNPELELCNAQTSSTACHQETTITTLQSTQTTSPISGKPSTSSDTASTTGIYSVILSTTGSTGGSDTSQRVTTTSIETTTSFLSLMCQHKSKGALIPYPHACRSYISCDFPFPTTRYCPAGLEFSSKILACVDPEVSSCNENNTPTATPASKAATDVADNPSSASCDPNVDSTSCHMSTTSPSSSSSPSSITSRPNKENICCGKPLGTQLPDPKDKKRFIICQYPIPKAYTCPYSTVYDAKKQKCTFQDTSTFSNTTLDPISSTDPAQSISTKSYNTSKSTNVVANKTQGTTSDPPSSRTVDPPALLTPTSDTTQEPPNETTRPIIPTDPTTTVIYPTNNPTEICRGQKSGAQFEYFGDCRRYNFCFANGGLTLECGSGWYFDPRKKMCVSPNSYQCPWPQR